MSFFSADSVTAGYGKTNVIKNVSFHLERGTLTGIVGANGCGKTTLIKAICGILPHTGLCWLEGTRLEGLSPRQMARLVSYVPQRSGISIDISALDVVLMGFNPRLGLLEHPTKQMEASAMGALDRVGLSGREAVNYLHLSEGQKQLCILARTLVSDSRLLLLDEPESALDFRYRHQMLDLIRSWAKDTSGAALVTLHDPMLALQYCDRLLLVTDGCISGILSPGTDSLSHMEQMLSHVYGSVSLRLCQNRKGEDRILMLREDLP